MDSKSKPNTLLKLLAISIAALIALPLIAAPVNAGLPSKTDIKICLVLPTTGGLGLIGVDEIRGATIAIQQANTILAAGTTGVSFLIPPPTADSGTNPSTANTGWNNLVTFDGCRITVGAAGSGETSGFLGDANTAQIPTISPSSTAASLAIPSDMLFRSPGNDLVQAPALAAWVYSLGIRHVGMITRQDPYGTGIRDGFKTAFLGLSGTEVADTTGTTYDPASIPAAQAATNSLDTQIGTYLGSNPANTVGAVIIAFEDDGHAIFDRARTLTNLPQVLWIGTDGIGGSRAFLPAPDGTGSVDVASFMGTKGNVTGTFPTNPVLGSGGTQMDELAYNGTLVPRRSGGSNVGTVNLTGTGYFEVYGVQPQPYWNYAYDAAVIAMLAVLDADSYVGLDIANKIGVVANQTIGATGLLSLGPSGDRAVQHYVLYGYDWDGTNSTCCFSWDFSGAVHGYYNADTQTLSASQPVASEAGGTIWTSLLQDLAETVTVAVPSLPNVYLALSIIFVAATLVITASRRKRL